MIGERLAEIRKDHGDTQNDLAKKLHVSVSSIRGWENDRNDPSHELLVQICRLYGISADYLLGLSNIDPVYEHRYRLTRFSPREIAELHNYEDYLTWKQKRRITE